MITQPDGTIQISRASPEQIVSAAELAHEIYRDSAIGGAFKTSEIVLQRWRWIMEENPVRSHVGTAPWIATRSGRILGHFGLIPVVAVVRGREFGAAWGRDFFVAPAARGGGLGPRLVATAAESVGHVLVAGLNPAATRAYKRAGFSDRGELPFYIKVLRPADLADTMAGRYRRRIVGLLATAAAAVGGGRAPRLSGRVRSIDSFDGSFDRWWSRLEGELPCVIRRTSATMNWRYRRHPSHSYQLMTIEGAREPRGFAVVRSGISRGLPAGFIVELLARPGDGDALADLIASGVQVLTDQVPGLAFIRTNTFGSGVLGAMLARGFVPAPSPFRWMINNPLDRAAWDSRCTMSLNSGDSDLDLI